MRESRRRRLLRGLLRITAGSVRAALRPFIAGSVEGLRREAAELRAEVARLERSLDETTAALHDLVDVLGEPGRDGDE